MTATACFCTRKLSRSSMTETSIASSTDGNASNDVLVGRGNGALQQLAFPLMTQDLAGGCLPHHLQTAYHEFMDGHKLDWMTADLSFLNTHSINFVDCQETRSVNAFSVGFHSGFFNSLFKYSPQNRVELRLGWLNCLCGSISTALAGISLRKCRVAVTEENCLSLFLASDFILCEPLRAQCLRFIERRCSVDPQAALGIWQFSRLLNLPDLTQVSLRCVLRSFSELRLTDSFLQLDTDALIAILSHKLLNCASELQVLQTISQWLQRQPENQPQEQRKQQIERLLCCVRFGHMESDEFEAALREPLITGNQEFLDFVRIFPLSSSFSDRHQAELAKSKPPRWPHQVLLLLGGWYRRHGPTAFCQVYDPRADVWDLRSPDAAQRHQVGWLDERSHACCALLGDVVHFVGGYSGAEALKSVLCFDRRRPHLGWYEGSCMLQARYYHCCAALDNYLYSIGGQTAERRLIHVERMRSNDNSWVAIEPLRRPCCEAAVVALAERLLVVGGFDGRAHLDTAETFCPAAGEWTLLTGFLNSPRTGLGLVHSPDGRGGVFAVCGRNSAGWLRTVESWLGESKGWRLHCEMSRPRSNFGCCILDGRIFLLGGICGPSEKEIMASVEWLEPGTKRMGTAHAMPFPASGLTTCVLDLLDYSEELARQRRRKSSSPDGFCPAPMRLLTDEDSDELPDDG
ncbi:hypothetical protein BOX15_Mlig030280g1 [Macrostomum lignano]|uniref:BACK domain-containing protein n=1 Tax=Macrostomum lignano TaxID=282301 RepID=A0A267F3H8_9PLAT|nr:hypothetical protein BOX15_Mlig030280g1 [Macrostomum lignano]